MQPRDCIRVGRVEYGAVPVPPAPDRRLPVGRRDEQALPLEDAEVVAVRADERDEPEHDRAAPGVQLARPWRPGQGSGRGRTSSRRSPRDQRSSIITTPGGKPASSTTGRTPGRRPASAVGHLDPGVVLRAGEHLLGGRPPRAGKWPGAAARKRVRPEPPLPRTTVVPRRSASRGRRGTRRVARTNEAASVGQQQRRGLVRSGSRVVDEPGRCSRGPGGAGRLPKGMAWPSATAPPHQLSPSSRRKPPRRSARGSCDHGPRLVGGGLGGGAAVGPGRQGAGDRGGAQAVVERVARPTRPTGIRRRSCRPRPWCRRRPPAIPGADVKPLGSPPAGRRLRRS